MSHASYDKRDMEFVLFDQLKVQDVCKYERYEDYDREIFESTIESAIKMATEQLAPANQSADREGVKVKDGQVFLPESFVPMYKTFCENGWVSVARNAQYGGMQMPNAVAVAAIETFCSANPSFMFTPGLTDAAGHLIENFGSDAQKELYVSRMYTGEWSGTMCLTEPQAGSSVGDLTTKAEPVEGSDHYLISGNKIFISSGDQQLTENIVHLVLARVPGDPAGTRGISLFIVPKHRSDEQGNLQGSNDVTLSGVEHKMGIHASATCALSFGDHGDCHGYLVGERCKGIVYMFQMMNEARLITGLQGAAIGNVAYQMSLAYAKERRQGPKVTDRSADPQSVAIIEHPDVRRNLMTMKAYGEAMRALCYYVGAQADHAHFAPDEETRTRANDIVDLLTPIAKAFCSDVGFKVTELAIQVHGGYGFISEYGVEQAMRDVKIASLYEGTNGIQALDLLGRKLRSKHGGLFLTWLQEINGQLEGWTQDETLGGLAKELEGAKNVLAEAVFALPALGKVDPEYTLLHATPFLRMFGLVECGRLLIEQAAISQDKLKEIWSSAGVASDDKAARTTLAEQREDVRFFENKLLTASFYVHQLLPEVGGLLKSLKSQDRSALDVIL